MTTESKNKIHAIKGTAFWCNHTRQSKYGNYGVELGRLDTNTVKGLKALGIPVKFDTEHEEGKPDFKGYYVKLKNDAAFAAKDMQGNVLPSQLNIGNGSFIWAAVRAKSWTHKDTGRSGVRGVVLGLKVVSLVEYDPEADNKAKAEQLLDGISGEGFVFGGAATAEDVSTDDTFEQEDVDALFADE